MGKELVSSLLTATNTGEINTILSSYTSLALSSYAQSFQATANATLSINEIFSHNESKSLPIEDSTFSKAEIDSLAKQVKFVNPSKQTFFYQLTQSGFDKKPLTNTVKNNIEIEREYRDLEGNIIDEAKLGNEVEVYIQVRSLNDRYLDNIAIVDLLPGGFEVVNDSVQVEDIDYADAREDRVIFFTRATPEVRSISYRIKAINTGKYTVPPLFAESMYDTGVNAHTGAMRIVVSK